MRLPCPPCIPILAAFVAFLAVSHAFGGFCNWKNAGGVTANADLVVDGALTPSPIPVGTPHTMAVSVTNRGPDAVQVTGVDITRALADGRSLGGWSMGPRGFRGMTVGVGETAEVFSRSGQNCGDAGNYNVHVIVHTNAGDFADTFTYTFT